MYMASEGLEPVEQIQEYVRSVQYGRVNDCQLIIGMGDRTRA